MERGYYYPLCLRNNCSCVVETATCSGEMLERTPSPWPHPTDHHFASTVCVLWKFGVCLQNAYILSRVNSLRHYQQKFERLVSWFACYLQAKLLRNNKHTWNVKRGSGEGRIKLKQSCPQFSINQPLWNQIWKYSFGIIVTQKDIFSHTGIFFSLKNQHRGIPWWFSG